MHFLKIFNFILSLLWYSVARSWNLIECLDISTHDVCPLFTCYCLFSTFINHAIRNTELRLILLSMVCGQVTFRRSILSAGQVLTWYTRCIVHHYVRLFFSGAFFSSFIPWRCLEDAMSRDAFWDKLFGRQETACWRARPYFPVDRLCNFDRLHAKRGCLDATTMRPRSS